MMKIATKPKSCRSGWVDALKNDGSTVGEETEYAEKRPSHPRTVAVAVAAMRAVLAGSKLLNTNNFAHNRKHVEALFYLSVRHPVINCLMPF
jgi:hypothetical protein